MKVMITGAAGFLGKRLTHALIKRGELVGPSGRLTRITKLVLADRVAVPSPVAPGLEGQSPEIQSLAGDLSNPNDLSALCEHEFDSLFHLASQLTLHAENDPDHAWQVNVAPLRALIASAGHTNDSRCPRVIFASSIAVFGGALPAEVNEDIPPLPQTTYGSHKAVNELLLADATRHGRIDGRALRLPIVLIRPGLAQPVVSDQVAAIAREPLEGRDFAAPFAPDTDLPVCSAGAAVAGFIALHDARAADLPPKQTLNLPGLNVTMAEMVAAASRAGATGRVTSAPDPATQAVVAGWPSQFSSRYAAGLGIRTDADFDAIVQDYLTHKEASA